MVNPKNPGFAVDDFGFPNETSLMKWGESMKGICLAGFLNQILK